MNLKIARQKACASSQRGDNLSASVVLYFDCPHLGLFALTPDELSVILWAPPLYILHATTRVDF